MGTSFMIRCRDVARLLSEDERSDCSAWRRVSVRLHLMMCGHCSRFARQLAWLGRTARDLARGFEEDEAVAGLETRVLRRLGLG